MMRTHNDIIELLIDKFGLDLQFFNEQWRGPCPIHGGDNPTAFCIKKYNGQYYWRCFTHSCHQNHPPNLDGLITALLSDKENRTVDPREIRTLINKWYPQKHTHKPKIDDLTRAIQILSAKTVNNETKLVNRDGLKHLINIPSTYFVRRGFSVNILNKFCVGDYPKKNRAIVPIFAPDGYNIMGFTGRFTQPICPLCGFSHVRPPCPDASGRVAKWLHTKTFQTKNYLYNYWNAVDHIKQTNRAVLVESTGNVWRLEEAGIHCSMAIFGTSFSPEQFNILNKLPIHDLYLCLDSGEAGERCAEEIYRKCRNLYNVHFINVEKNDIAEYTVPEVKELFFDKINHTIR